MKKVFKLFALVFSIFAIVTLVACSKNEVTGTLEATTTSTKITATASFNKNTILEESTTIVNVKLYNEDVSELIEKKTVDLGEEKVEGSVTFENLTTDKTYVLKLYVSYGGNEYFIYEKKATTTSSGSSEEKPIEVSSVSDFLAIEDNKDAYYKLVADIDFTEQSALSLCSSSEPFKGVVDGNGYSIKNFTISTGEYSGLFEYVEDATFKNLKLENASISVTSSTKFVGALAGYAVNTEIENVKVDGFVMNTDSGPTTTAQFGGLVGAISSLATTDDKKTTSTVTNSKVTNIDFDLIQVRPSSNYLFYCGGFAGRISGNTTVTNCTASGVLNCKSRASSGTAYVGGFAGAIESSQTISKSASFVTVSMVRYSNTFGVLCMGGFAGSNATGQINLNDCIAVADLIALSDEGGSSDTTNLSAKAYIGGLVGLVTSTPKGVKNCYYAKANLGIMVKQADETQTTNYVDACYVSETVGYAQSSVANKIKEVYSYDSCLDVIGMTKNAEEANTTSLSVLSNENKALFEEAIVLRQSLKTKLEDNITLSKYNYSEDYSTTETLDFGEAVTPVIVGNSSTVSVEGNKLTVQPGTDATKNVIRFTINGTSASLNTILVIATKVVTNA